MTIFSWLTHRYFFFNPNFIATLKIAGTLQKSSEVMGMVNNLVKLPEISAQMQEMSKEMMKVPPHYKFCFVCGPDPYAASM